LRVPGFKNERNPETVTTQHFRAYGKFRRNSSRKTEKKGILRENSPRCGECKSHPARLR